MSHGFLEKLVAPAVLAAALCTNALANDGSVVLRHQKDLSRNREWMLTPQGVTLFDSRARRTAAVIELPQWVWAGESYLCPPDLALGPNGEALVSSNVVPSIWRIDPVSLQVTRHDLAVDSHVDKDVGFSGLTYAAELGVFLAVSEFGALWRIDPLLRRAQEVKLDSPVRRACRLVFRRNVLCAHNGVRPWSIRLAPDLRSAYTARESVPAVRRSPCNAERTIMQLP
jgi:hypothetical protein